MPVVEHNLIRVPHVGYLRYIIEESISALNLDCVSEKDKEKLKSEESINTNKNEEPPEKKQRLSKADKKKLRGQNKARPITFRRNKEVELCNTLINLKEGEEYPKCNKKNCAFMHDIQEYLKNKPQDICNKNTVIIYFSRIKILVFRCEML